MVAPSSMSGSTAARTARRRSSGVAAGALAAIATGCRGDVQYPQTTFHPVSGLGEAQNAVFYTTFWWTMAILIVVFALLLYAVVRFREQPDTPTPQQIHGSTRLEIAWTIVPALIVVFIAVPTVRTIFATQSHDDPDALVIEVVGHQWWWEFRYPQHDVTTANQFYIPVDRPIRLQLHSADVVHSFWVPRIGGKRDVNPLSRVLEGPSHNLNFISFTPREPGIYHGQCAEFCGASHAIMLMTAVAVPDDEFAAWIASMQEQPAPPAPPPPPAGVAPAEPQQQPQPEPEQPQEPQEQQPQPQQQQPQQPQPQPQQPQQQQPQPQQPQPRRALQAGIPVPTGIGQRVEPPLSGDELAAAGEEVFMRTTCVACHTIANSSARGVLGPNLTRYATRPTVGAGAARNTQENVEAWIRNPHSMKPGALMPGTRTGGGGMPATNLTDEEVRAVAVYLLSLR